jgi:hypothetical protein
MRKTLSTEAAATRRSTSKSLGKISLLLAGSPRHRVRVRVLHFKEEKIFYPRGMVDNLRALYQAGSDAPEENPPSPRTNPEVTKLQQNL